MKQNIMSIQEAAIEHLEAHIPEMAESAVTQAYWQALAAGSSVLESENGVIYEVFPDGTRKALKTIEPPTAVAIGEKRILP